MGRKPKVMKPKDVLDHVERKEVIVTPKGWPGGVRISPPTLEALTALKMRYPDEKDFEQKSLFLFLPDFSPEDVKQLAQGDGLKMAALMEAIAEVVGDPLDKVGN